MDIDLGTGPSNEGTLDYTSIPAGTYLVQIAEVRTGFTRNGDERWGLRLVVAEGEFTGRLAAWDGLVFSPRSNARLRHVFSALGLPARGKISVVPDDLVGRRVFAEIRPSEYTPPDGERVRRNEVPYTGYKRVEDGGPRATPGASHGASEVAEGHDGDVLPF